MGLCGSSEAQISPKAVKAALKDAAQYHREEGGTSLHMTQIEISELYKVYDGIRSKTGKSTITKEDFGAIFHLDDKMTLKTLFDIFDKDQVRFRTRASTQGKESGVQTLYSPSFPSEWYY